MSRGGAPGGGGAHTSRCRIIKSHMTAVSAVIRLSPIRVIRRLEQCVVIAPAFLRSLDSNWQQRSVCVWGVYVRMCLSICVRESNLSCLAIANSPKKQKTHVQVCVCVCVCVIFRVHVCVCMCVNITNLLLSDMEEPVCDIKRSIKLLSLDHSCLMTGVSAI